MGCCRGVTSWARCLPTRCFWCVMVQEEDKVRFLHALGVEGAARLGAGSRPLCSSSSAPSNITVRHLPAHFAPRRKIRTSAFKLLSPQGEQHMAAYTAVMTRVFTWQVLTGLSALHELLYQASAAHMWPYTCAHTQRHTHMTSSLQTRQPRSGGLSDGPARAQQITQSRPTPGARSLLCSVGKPDAQRPTVAFSRSGRQGDLRSHTGDLFSSSVSTGLCWGKRGGHLTSDG